MILWENPCTDGQVLTTAAEAGHNSCDEVDGKQKRDRTQHDHSPEGGIVPAAKEHHEVEHQHREQ
eukprot:CAMPEP_0177759730 /NCGR_PEP_ID=MMETSP0491_2-20121128/4884_1 /TAXON_ID=63592 /ORGANISM="Tetraselmis chuii, Strain PLY429" /LENGTH=64 /DNA_ID=CAMNT_0019275571 /DNA_START=56 /DNA_END=250 /DNA_ORIENTATION=+